MNNDYSPEESSKQSSENKSNSDQNQATHNRKLSHPEILFTLLHEVHPIDFRQYLGIPEDEQVRQKHIVVGVIKQLLEVAKHKRWNLCKKFDYVYIFNGAYWAQCDKDAIKDFLGQAATKMGCPDYEGRHFEFKDKLFKQFLSEARLPTPAEKNRGRILINLQNGTFEFTSEGWRIKPFDPDDFLTYQLPFEFIENASCPLFESYLLKVLPDFSSRLVLQEFAAFPFTELNLEKCLVLTGSGRNGKSVFFNIYRALLGDTNVLTYSMGLFAHEYNRSKLVNVLVNYSSEKGIELNPDLFKALVSGEPLQARLPYGQPFTLYNKVKFVINCNELPKETEHTEAYFRRFEIIPFDVKISEEEKIIDLAEQIIARELPGVFNWLLVGLDRLLKQKSFTACEKSKAILSEFKKQSDSVGLFIEERQYSASTTDKKALNSIYQDYKSFCSEDGYKAQGKHRFSKTLESKGFEKTRLNDGSTGFYITQNSISF